MSGYSRLRLLHLLGKLSQIGVLSFNRRRVNSIPVGSLTVNIPKEQLETRLCVSRETMLTKYSHLYGMSTDKCT